MGEDAVVSLRGITNSFGDNVVHQDLDLDIRRGEIIGLIGGSGSGKSVLLRTILGLNQPKSGSIRVMGVDMLQADEGERDSVRQQWGVLFQSGALFSSQTVSENVQMPMRESTRLDERMRNEIADMKIRLVGLPDNAATLYPSELSGGMRKRAGLARALALDPALLFLDEPTAGLDPLGAAAFDSLILSMRDTMGLTVCMVTHDLDSLYTICDRVAVLADKHIVAVGTIPELLQSDHPWIHEYFTGPRGRAAAASHKGA